MVKCIVLGLVTWLPNKAKDRIAARKQGKIFGDWERTPTGDLALVVMVE